MKAVKCKEYGGPEVLELVEVEKPFPEDNEVLIKIYAASVTMGDCEIRNLNFSFAMRILIRLGFGIKRPRYILGQELAGEVEAIGKEVERFKVGDQVFGTSGFSMGANAEYICLNEDAIIAKKSPNISFEEAAVIPIGGLNALFFLRKLNIKKNQKVLINGAGGTIGTFAVQLAKMYGAEVTGVDKSIKLDMIRSIGADHVIDYASEDFTKNGIEYDVIFDVVRKSSYSGCLNSLTEKGIYILANPSFSRSIRGKLTSMISDKRVISGSIIEKSEDLRTLMKYMEEGKLKSIIDKSYKIERIKEAHTYVDSDNKKGNIVLSLV